MQNQVTAIRKSKSKAEDALRIEREALQKEKMRLAEESQVGGANRDLILEFIFPVGAMLLQGDCTILCNITMKIPQKYLHIFSASSALQSHEYVFNRHLLRDSSN